MAWTEQIGTQSWRVRYHTGDGHTASMSGFTTKLAAENYANDIESDQRRNTWLDPARGKSVDDNARRAHHQEPTPPTGGEAGQLPCSRTYTPEDRPRPVGAGQADSPGGTHFSDFQRRGGPDRRGGVDCAFAAAPN